MSDKEKIKAEIERQLENYDAYNSREGVVLSSLLSFIDSMQKETKCVWNSASNPPDTDRLVITCEKYGSNMPYGVGLCIYRAGCWEDTCSEDLTEPKVDYWMDIPFIDSLQDDSKVVEFDNYNADTKKAAFVYEQTSLWPSGLNRL